MTFEIIFWSGMIIIGAIIIIGIIIEEWGLTVWDFDYVLFIAIVAISLILTVAKII